MSSPTPSITGRNDGRPDTPHLLSSLFFAGDDEAELDTLTDRITSSIGLSFKVPEPETR
jgi:hypothetical protein